MINYLFPRIASAIAVCGSLVVLNVCAQDGQVTQSDPLAEIVNKVNTNLQPISPTTMSGGEDSIEESVENILTKRMERDGITAAWDETNERYSQNASYTVNIPTDADLEDYFAYRQIACLGALIRAQIDIATFMGTEATMDVAFVDPGNPVFNEPPNAALRKETESKIQALKKQLASANLKLEEGKDWTSADRMRTAADALLKKLDQNYAPSKSAEEKAKFKEQVGIEAREIEINLAALEEKMKNYQQSFRKSTTAGIVLDYDHVIFGITALAWAENYSKGSLSMGLVYAWSPQMAKRVRAALTGDPSMIPTDGPKGPESLEAWLQKQPLDQIGAFRYYIDDKGSPWFLGTGYCPKDVEAYDQIARINAIQNLYMPLFSTFTGKQEQRTVRRAGNNSKKSKVKLPDHIVTEMIENFKSQASANTRGLSVKRRAVVAWPIVVDKKEGRGAVGVSVVALSAKSAGSALKAAVETAEHAAAVNHENNRRALELKQLNAIVNKAKAETPPSRVPGLLKPKKPGPSAGSSAPRSVPAGVVPNESTDPVGPARAAPNKRNSPGKLQDDF